MFMDQFVDKLSARLLQLKKSVYKSELNHQNPVLSTAQNRPLILGQNDDYSSSAIKISLNLSVLWVHFAPRKIELIGIES